jgi:hypothetical protein
MPGAGTAGDRGAGHPFADVRRFPERHQVGQPGAFVHSLHIRISQTRSSQGHFMIADSFGRYTVETVRDHGLDM